jgi:hypothetical protein
VQKAGGEETPPLVCAYGRGAEVASPMKYVESRGLGEGDAACHHGQKDQNVDCDQSDRDGVRTARTGREGLLGEGLLGEGLGDGSVVHVSTVLALCRWRRGLESGGVRLCECRFAARRAALPSVRAIPDSRAGANGAVPYLLRESKCRYQLLARKGTSLRPKHCTNDPVLA